MRRNSVPLMLVGMYGVLLGGAFLPAAATADTYFNSSEAICDPSDPTLLWCDDFEDGSWVETCDGGGAPCCQNALCQANGPEEQNPNNDGWWGNGYTSWPDPQGTAWGRCGGLGASSDCAGYSGVLDGTPGNSRISGRKFFSPSHATETEVYMRWYLKQLPGFVMGHEKMMTFENDGTGYRPAILTKNNSSGCLAISNKSQGGVNLSQNLGNQLCLQNDRWYYIEVRIKLDTNGSDGIYELWFDDCGADGAACNGQPGTKRASHTNVNWSGSGQSFDNTWLENWSNGPPSNGEQYYDQMVAATRRIGPIGSTGGPPPPPPPPPPQPPAAPYLLD